MSRQNAPAAAPPRQGQIEGAGPVLSIRSLSKTFPGQRALDAVDLDVDAGTIRGIVGQNGCGKSTLIKVLAGYHVPDEGSRVEVCGEPLTFGRADESQRAGLRFVHQDLGLVPTLSAADNLALGRGYHRRALGAIDWRAEERVTRELFVELGLDLDVHAPVAMASATERTGVAIARALQGWTDAARVLVLDEPTATLPQPEVARLHEIVRAVRDRGVAVMYVSHHLHEVFALTDQVTVLRGGCVVGTWATGELDESRLIELTVGQALDRTKPHRPEVVAPEPMFEVVELTGDTVEGVSFSVAPGEVIGVAGLTGSGREAIGGMLAGARERRGTVRLDGREVPPGRPDWNVAHGIAYVPPDRLEQAALATMTSRENLTLSVVDAQYGAVGWRRQAESGRSRSWIAALDVRPADPEAVFGTLSGGNQQKLVIARALMCQPRVLILDEPTRGVDVGAKAAIYTLVRKLAREGLAVIVISTDSEELMALADQVVVLARGRRRELRRADGLDADELTSLVLHSA